ncbi:MAG: thiol peroxidase [Candidatus Latescibacterota bacterium]
MKERIGAVTLEGLPLTLIGNEVKNGDKAPDFEAVAPSDVITVGITKKNLSSFPGKTIVISAVPSLDTPVCDLQTHRFSEEAGKFGPAVEMVTISMDLPYAQARWIRENKLPNMSLLSDHLDASFGKAYGILVKEFRLLARSVFIIDPEGVVRYTQLLKDLNTEPDYDDVLRELSNVQQEEAGWKKA